MIEPSNVESGECFVVRGIEAVMRHGYQSHEGYLLLADISGYTHFLTGTELEHAQAIVRELTMLVRDRLVPPMQFVKVEGDAVFCYADVAVFVDGERLLQLLEVCYFDFSNHLMNMTRNTTCPCAACAAVGSLDLKFVCHFGTFVIDAEGDGVDLAGADVILAHRLLKNTVSQSTGVQAYALLTEACLRHLPQAVDLPAHDEYYESFGVTTGRVHDLKPVLAEMHSARLHYVRPDDADYVLTVEVPIPPVVAWNYWLDPLERQRRLCRHFSSQARTVRRAMLRVVSGRALRCTATTARRPGGRSSSTGDLSPVSPTSPRHRALGHTWDCQTNWPPSTSPRPRREEPRLSSGSGWKTGKAVSARTEPSAPRRQRISAPVTSELAPHHRRGHGEEDLH